MQEQKFFILEKKVLKLLKSYEKKEYSFNYYESSFKHFKKVFPSDKAKSTKILLDYLLSKESKNIKGNVLEMGCGLGLLGIIIFKEFRNQIDKMYFSDISNIAYKNTKINLQLNNLSNYLDKNIFVSNGNLFEKLPKNFFDFIFFNPPFAINIAIKDSNYNDLNTIFKFVSESKQYLRKNGKALFIFALPFANEKIFLLLNNYGWNKIKLNKEEYFGFNVEWYIAYYINS